MELGLTISNPFLKQEDGTPIVNERRFTHTHVIGKSGVGKSTALERWAIDDILNGEAIAFFDPHGHSAAEILKHVPPERRRDVIVFDPADRRFPIGFNPLHNIARERIPFVASSLVDSFPSLWASSWGPQLEQFLYNGIAALLEVPDGTLLGLKFLLTAPDYRRRLLAHVRDPLIRDFWASDFERHMPEREQRERTLSTLNKIGALIADPSLGVDQGARRTAHGPIAFARLVRANILRPRAPRPSAPNRSAVAVQPEPAGITMEPNVNRTTVLLLGTTRVRRDPGCSANQQAYNIYNQDPKNDIHYSRLPGHRRCPKSARLDRGKYTADQNYCNNP